MSTVYDVAQWLLQKESMSHKKLQKMAYYSYAWFYTLTGRKLFDGNFEAWIHGPVNKTLYTKYHGRGWNPLSADKDWINRMTSTENSILEAVYDSFGKFSADELESMTHQEFPWIEARGNIPINQSCTTPINDETIRMFYAKLGEANQIE